MRTVRLLSVCICVAMAWNLGRLAEAQGPPLPDPDPVVSGPQPASPAAQPVLERPQPATHLPVAFMADAPAAVPPAPAMPTTPQAPGRPAAPDMTAPPAAVPVFGEAPPAGTEAASGAYAPQMLGDSLAYFSRVTFTNQVVSPGSGNSGSLLMNIPVPALAGSAFKIADNESPLPQDRVFLNLNYFTDVYHSARPEGSPDLRITRTLLGFEKTFLNGDASIEVRVPIFQLDDNAGDTSTAELGDITIAAKFALLRNSASGWTVTGGLAITLPTGPGLAATQLVPGTTFLGVPGFVAAPPTIINPTIWQPWLGFFYAPSEQLYVHGFSSLAFPTNDNVPTVWFNDLAAGYHLYRAGTCDIIPTVEMHLTDGFGHRGSQAYPVGVVDTFDTVLGVHFAWSQGTILTFGYGFPWTGPQPFSSELICQLNHRF